MLLYKVPFFEGKIFLVIYKKVPKFDIMNTCKISGQNLLKQKSFVKGDCCKMDPKIPENPVFETKIMDTQFSTCGKLFFLMLNEKDV